VIFGHAWTPETAPPGLFAEGSAISLHEVKRQLRARRSR